MRILFVCTGNICRSPSAEGVLRRRLQDCGMDGAVAVESCGTHSFHVGDPPDARAISVGAALGYDISELRARAWRTADARAFDLILAMESHHVEWLTQRIPGGATPTVARLLDYAPGQPCRDLPDPYYGGIDDFERMFALIETGVAGLLPDLRGSKL